MSELLPLFKNNDILTRIEMMKLTGLSIRSIDYRIRKLKDDKKIEVIKNLNGDMRYAFYGVVTGG